MFALMHQAKQLHRKPTETEKKKQRELRHFGEKEKKKKLTTALRGRFCSKGLNIKSTVLFLSYMCAQVFITHGESLHSSKHCKLTGF